MRNNSSLPPAIERILEAAHWAPSGDNAQPWSFALDGGGDITVSIHPNLGNVYEYRDAEPTMVTSGTVLENIAIAAPSVGKRASWQYRGFENGTHRIAVHLQDGPTAQHPLLEFIRRRSVNRWPYRMTPLTQEAKAELAGAVDGDITVEWHESLAARRKVAGLTSLATDIRLRIPETFETHRKVVDWERRLSPDGIPAQALGLDAMTLKIMRWSMAKWQRTHFGNKMGSPFFAGLQMDTMPGLCSAAYFAFRMRARASGADRVIQLLRAGQSVQRFWLTATKLGLAMQPCMAVLAFTHYGVSGEAFTTSDRERATAGRLAAKAADVLGDPEELVFLARIGVPKPRRTESRSTRLPLADKLRNS